MKLVFKIFLCFILLLNLCSCKKEQPADIDLLDKIKAENSFIVGINENSRPFAYRDKNGNLTGFDVDLIREISKNIFGTDEIIQFKSLSPSARILSLNEKKVDIVISTMTITKERLSVIDFSNSYFLSGQAIMVKKNGKIRTGKDLNEKTIGIILGTTAASNIKYIASKSIIKGFKNYQDAFKELKKGNIDAISTDDVILQGIISDEPSYKILPERYSREYYGIALRKDVTSQNLKAAINETLINMEKSGKLIQLEKKYDINYRKK